MPKLLVFAPCEKAITATDGPISLVSVLEKVISRVPASTELGEHASLPMRWYVVTVWYRDPSDAGKRFEQMVLLLGGDGTSAMRTEPAEIVVTSGEKTRQRTIGIIDQFPITDGNLSLQLKCREIGTEEWITVAEYPIEVELIREPEE